MKKTKTQKGITLIALIITIIVLLILAITTIGSMRDSKIIEYAQEAGSEYTQKKEEEELKLAVIESMLEKNGKFDYDTFKSNYIPNNFNLNDDDTITSNTGNTFSVDEKGNVTFNGNDGQGGGGDNTPPTGTTTVETLKELYVNKSATAVLDIPNFNSEGGYYPLVEDPEAHAYVTQVSTAIIHKDGKKYTFLVDTLLNIVDVVETPIEIAAPDLINNDKVLANFYDFIRVIDGDTYYTCDIVEGTGTEGEMLYAYKYGIDSSYTAVLLDSSDKYENVTLIDPGRFENIERVYIPITSGFVGTVNCSKGTVRFNGIESPTEIDTPSGVETLKTETYNNIEYYVVNLKNG